MTTPNQQTPEPQASVREKLDSYQREAFQRFFAHLGESWPTIDDLTADRVIAMSAAIDALEAQRQQNRMRPVEFRVRMFKLLLAALPAQPEPKGWQPPTPEKSAELLAFILASVNAVGSMVSPREAGDAIVREWNETFKVTR